jgi:hypothetical protein
MIAILCKNDPLTTCKDTNNKMHSISIDYKNMQNNQNYAFAINVEFSYYDNNSCLKSLTHEVRNEGMDTFFSKIKSKIHHDCIFTHSLQYLDPTGTDLRKDELFEQVYKFTGITFGRLKEMISNIEEKLNSDI